MIVQKVNNKDKEQLLPIMEQFYTIQGEGTYTGHAAYFIRLAGCNVGCHWCDVKESWDAEAHPQRPVSDIISEAAKFPSRIAVITGGEPLMYNLDKLCEGLKEEGFRIHLETSGAYPISGKIDWICLSPKKFKLALPDIARIANELKVVVYNESDFRWAEQYARQVPDNCALFLQPEWSKAEVMLPAIIKYVQERPQWKISLQTHKYIGVD